MTKQRQVSWTEVQNAAAALADRWSTSPLDGVYGVPRGGITPAALVAGHLGAPLVETPVGKVLVVDDLVDSGATAKSYAGAWGFDALFRKSAAPADLAPHARQMGNTWLVFPWERTTGEDTGPVDAVRRLLQHIGEDPDRPGLVDTPGRVLRALSEMTSGYQLDPEVVLMRTFPDHYDEMVVVRGVEFTSLCEHHVLTFSGSVTVAYVPSPGAGVVGLSKLARLVELYARRLQVQERMTMQIAEAIETHLRPAGVGVVVAARHSCMGCRGVRKPNADMVTSALLGTLRSDPAQRAEFLALARSALAHG